MLQLQHSNHTAWPKKRLSVVSIVGVVFILFCGD